MAPTPDPVTLSPEENVAADLAFTTNGLTTGNALYTSAAENNILTDGSMARSRAFRGSVTTCCFLNSLSRGSSRPRQTARSDQPLPRAERHLRATDGGGDAHPQKILPTGYDFLADGAQAVRNNLHTVGFPSAALQDSVGANPSINVPGLSQPPWTAADIRTTFLQSPNPADIASLNAPTTTTSWKRRTDHWSTADVTPARLRRASCSPWAAMAVSMFPTPSAAAAEVSRLGAALQHETGRDVHREHGLRLRRQHIRGTFGAAAFDLREELPFRFNSVGEEWAATLQQYFATAGAYDVYDEKVMEETTFYGLPFWHFSTAGSRATFHR